MICLSFDTDHIDAGRMHEFLESTQIPGTATFFCTEGYDALEGVHEACPHPTLDLGGDWEGQLDQAREAFPEAQGFRAHACLSSHALSLELAARGFRYVSSQDNFGRPTPGPFREAWGLWQLPIYYMETLDLAYTERWPDRDGHRPFSAELIDHAIETDDVCVFDFHPIHLLINSESVSGYESRRDAFLAGAPVEEIRHRGKGARSFYDRLIGEMDAAGLVSVPLGELVERTSRSAAAGA
jgi:hypothetical protein